MSAWERWRRADSFAHLDAASARLLGHVYRNLQQSGGRDPAIAALKDFHRRTWRANHLRLHAAATVLARLRAAGIEAMLLKGAALIVAYYHDAGLRPMDDVDVLVRPRQAAAAAAVLQDLGWAPRDHVTDRRVRASHATAFGGPLGQQLDLHWHLLPESCAPHADDRFWACAGTARLEDVEIRLLDPAHQLLHACAHGVRWEPVVPLRWVVDAAAVMRRPPGLDWGRLLEETERHRLALPVRAALSYLQAAFGLPVPPETLMRLRRIPVPPSERLAHRWRTRPPGRLLGRLPEHWLRYRRLRQADAEGGSIGFLEYLEVTFGCEGLRDLARRGLWRHRWRRQAQAGVTRYEHALTVAGPAAGPRPSSNG